MNCNHLEQFWQSKKSVSEPKEKPEVDNIRDGTYDYPTL